VAVEDRRRRQSRDRKWRHETSGDLKFRHLTGSDLEVGCRPPKTSQIFAKILKQSFDQEKGYCHLFRTDQFRSDGITRFSEIASFQIMPDFSKKREFRESIPLNAKRIEKKFDETSYIRLDRWESRFRVLVRNGAMLSNCETQFYQNLENSVRLKKNFIIFEVDCVKLLERTILLIKFDFDKFLEMVNFRRVFGNKDTYCLKL